MQQKLRETVNLFYKKKRIKLFKVLKTKSIQALLQHIEKPKLFSINGKYFSYDLLNFFFCQKLIRYQQANTFSVLDICLSLNFIVPHFCYHFNLSIAGNCRMCLVEIAPSAKPVVSCGFNLSVNQLILTDSLVVKRARAFIMEFLLVNHPLDCPVCDQGGECDLQDQSLIYGNDRGRFYHPSDFKRAVSEIICTPMINFTLTRCIHCTRCTRFLAEIGGEKTLGMLGRGFFSEIGTYNMDINLTSELSSNITDFCPVGALTGKSYALSYRNWDDLYLESIDLSESSCASIRVYSNLNKITRLLPQYNTVLEVNWIHDKTRHLIDGLNLQRINYPMTHGINIRHFPRRTMNLVSFVWDQLEDKFPRLKLIKTIKEKISSQKIHRIILELRLKQAIVRSKQAIVRSKQIKRREKTFYVHSQEERLSLLEQKRTQWEKSKAYGDRSLSDAEIVEEAKRVVNFKVKRNELSQVKSKEFTQFQSKKLTKKFFKLFHKYFTLKLKSKKHQKIECVSEEILINVRTVIFKKITSSPVFVKGLLMAMKIGLVHSLFRKMRRSTNPSISGISSQQKKFPCSLEVQHLKLQDMFSLRYDDHIDLESSEIDKVGLLRNTRDINDLMFEVLTKMKLKAVLVEFLKKNLGRQCKISKGEKDKLLYLGERSVQNFIQRSWRNLSKILLVSLNNFPVYRKIKTFAGNFLDLITLLQLKECSLITGNNNLYNFSNSLLFNSMSLINDDFDFNYIYNSTNISQFNFFFLINLNLRFQNPVLNAKIRQKQLWAKFTKIFYIGPKYNLTYKYNHLGTTTKILLKIVEGRYYLVNFLTNPKVKGSTLLLYGSDLCNIYKNAFYRSFFNALKAINKFMSVNCLVRNVSSVSAFDLGWGKFVNQTSRCSLGKELTKGVTESINYYLGCDNYLTRFNITQTFLKNQLFVYQGSSFDKYYNFVDVFLPNVSYYETKHEFFVNCYGLLKRTRRVLLPMETGAKENDEIIYLVYNILMRLSTIIKRPKDKLKCTKSTSIYLRILKKFLNKSFNRKNLYRFFTIRLETHKHFRFEVLFSTGFLCLERVSTLRILKWVNGFISMNSYYSRVYKFLFIVWKFHLEFYGGKFSESFLFHSLNKKKGDFSLLAELREVSQVSPTFIASTLLRFYTKKLTQTYISSNKSHFKIVSILFFFKKTW